MPTEQEPGERGTSYGVSGGNIVHLNGNAVGQLASIHLRANASLDEVRTSLLGLLQVQSWTGMFPDLTPTGRDVAMLLLDAEPNWFTDSERWVLGVAEAVVAGDKAVIKLGVRALQIQPDPDTNMSRWRFELRQLISAYSAETPPDPVVPVPRSRKPSPGPLPRKWTRREEGLHLGWTTPHPPSPRKRTATVDIDAYLDIHDMQVAIKVVEALDHLAATLGYDELDHGTLKQGSFRWRTRAATRRARDELASRLIKVERMLELQHLDGRQADVDTKEAQAVAQLMEALKEVPRACMRVGSILIVKYIEAGAPVVLVRNLSQPEIRLLERYPEIQQNPANVLTALATAAASSVQDPVRP